MTSNNGSFTDYIERVEFDLEKIYVHRNVLTFNGNINENTVSHAIRLFQSKPGITRMDLTTMGGSVPDGLSLVSYIREKKPNLHIKVNGYCHSMGTWIFAAAKKRSIDRYSYLMYHQITSYVFDLANTDDLRSTVDLHEFLYDIMSDLLNPDGKEELQDFIDRFTNSRKDTCIRAEEAKSLGLATHIV